MIASSSSICFWRTRRAAVVTIAVEPVASSSRARPLMARSCPAVLRVNAVHEDVKFTRAMTRAVQDELEELASWFGLERV